MYDVGVFEFENGNIDQLVAVTVHPSDVRSTSPRGGELASAVEGPSVKQPRYRNIDWMKKVQERSAKNVSFCIKKMCSFKLRHTISEGPCAGRAWRKLSVSEAGKVLITLCEPSGWGIGVLG